MDSMLKSLGPRRNELGAKTLTHHYLGDLSKTPSLSLCVPAMLQDWLEGNTSGPLVAVDVG